MKNIPRPLIIECCKALEARQLNHGAWPDACIPQCFITLRDEYYSHLDDHLWVLVIEGVIKDHAVKLVANELCD